MKSEKSYPQGRAPLRVPYREVKRDAKPEMFHCRME
jgi:hypothetical protein